MNAQVAVAREAARQGDGRFGVQQHSSPGTGVLDGDDPSFAGLHDRFCAALDELADARMGQDDEAAGDVMAAGSDWCDRFEAYAAARGIDLGEAVRRREALDAQLDGLDEAVDAEDFWDTREAFFEVAEDMHRAVLDSDHPDVAPADRGRRAVLAQALGVRSGDLPASLAGRLDDTERAMRRGHFDRSHRGMDWDDVVGTGMSRAGLDLPGRAAEFAEAVQPGSTAGLDADGVDRWCRGRMRGLAEVALGLGDVDEDDD